jgi:hypothetical protein
MAHFKNQYDAAVKAHQQTTAAHNALIKKHAQTIANLKGINSKLVIY